MPTTVTLLLFSGRRDPSWELASDEASELAALLRGVSSAQESSNLGYRGFLVESEEGRVIVRDLPEVERFLLDTGRAHLDDGIVAAVESSL